MANDIQKLYSLPDISFVSDVAPDFDTVLQRLVSDYEARYEEETGKKVVLRPGDKEYIELTVYAAEFFQMYQQIDFSAKMNLLKYSKGDYLKHLGAFKKTFVQEPKAAVTTARFTLSESRKEVVYIPAGTRITAGDGIYFETDDYAEVTAGETYVDIDCTCQTAGTVGNDYTPGQLEIIVDPVPYVATVSNITKTDGGAGEETEESFRERIYLAPSSYSTAGPSDAYEYWTISTHSLTRRLTAILFNKNRFVQFIFITLYQSPPQPLLLPPFFHPIFSFSARISGANRPRIGWGLGVRTIGSGYR